MGVLAEKVLGLVLSDSRLTKLRPRRCQGREPCFARRYRNFKEWHKAPHPTLATSLGATAEEVANRGFDYRQIARSLIGKAQDLTPEAGPKKAFCTS